MKFKEKMFQPVLLFALLIIVLTTVDLNIPQIILKTALSLLLLGGLLFSWFEKKKILDELTHKYEDMSILMENMYKYYPDFIVCKDKNLKFTLCNNAFKQAFKINRLRDIKDKKISNFLDEHSSEIVTKHDNMVLEKGDIVKFKVHSKGNNIHYECLSVPLKKGKTIKGVATLIKDITEEEHLKEQLNESYSQVASVINNLPMVAYITDIDGNYLMGNKKSYKFYTEGIDPENHTIQIDLTAIQETQEEENRHVIETKKILVTDKYLKAIDGSFHWYAWRKVPWITNTGEVKGVIIFIANIDATKNAQKQRDNYIATLSHDLKTPTLAQIRTLELFLKGAVGELNNNQQDLLKLMLDSSHYMYSMVDTLVSTYKYENGEVVLTYESFNLLELIQQCVEELDNLIKTSQINIKIESKITTPIINADKIQLKRVIENLLSNGVSYSFKNSTLTILINEVRENNTPKICVKFINNSPYMNTETINNIFKRYVSHADKFNRVGAGLGLYLFKQIIDAHKGNVFVTSSKDDINTFGFVINK